MGRVNLNPTSTATSHYSSTIRQMEKPERKEIFYGKFRIRTIPLNPQNKGESKFHPQIKKQGRKIWKTGLPKVTDHDSLTATGSFLQS